MNLMKLQDLKEHDVYEFSYAENGLNHWNKNSVFLSIQDFSLLIPYLEKVFRNYHYYGPQQIKLEEWEMVKQLYKLSKEKMIHLLNFFLILINGLNIKRIHTIIFGF